MSSFGKKVIGYFTPAKCNVVDPCTPEFGVVEEVPSVYITKVGHATLGIIYSVFLFGYVAFLIHEWTIRPTYYQYNQLDADDYPIRNLRLYAECTDAPRCGDVNITVDYTGVMACRGIPPQRFQIPAADATPMHDVARYGVNLTLCYTEDPVFNTHNEHLNIPGVIVTFGDIQATVANPVQGIVRVSEVQMDWTLKPLRLVNMDKKQVKTLVMTQSINQDHTEYVSADAVPLGIQYDGKHKSDRATFILAAAPYVDTINKWRTHWLTIVGTFGSCAMAAWVVFVIMLFIIPLWPVLFPSDAQVLLNEGEARAKAKRAAQQS
uniref:Uncharacterized protein n=1 Tax=Neobodo designis TaxID=312471 RepID=A0A7S1QZM6_NEODS|eukprot:CAMPEP_0174828712 /NCGR_PEP_ID=MMETSP1114-20130205/1500_1 /TAXON_ID=312471 /ORGANISM="Neobodo designis, Strain CCAP 1951/1" /LENGTH=320 /DNA_ID=CAMNT_0016062437 /DNA_START=126 /DNA_END=1088 /DNA_ORIENTATION=+